MKRFFVPNLCPRGRIIRGVLACLLFGAAALAFESSLRGALVLAAGGAFLLFEALRGWCALRACGIQTRL